MKRHTYTNWGLGHMSHPKDPTNCCSALESATIHRCMECVSGGHPRDWRYCPLPFGHDGNHHDPEVDAS